MKHSYTVGCACQRCTRERTRRTAQSSADFARNPQRRSDALKAARKRVRTFERRPIVGSAEWAETRGDDLDESPDY